MRTAKACNAPPLSEIELFVSEARCGGTRDTGWRCGFEIGDGGGGAESNRPLAGSTLPVAGHARYDEDAVAACMLTQSTAEACDTPTPRAGALFARAIPTASRVRVDMEPIKNFPRIDPS